jgi:hypothetical protein
MGHSIDACAQSQHTTFGAALCTKEDQDKYTNIPISVFLQNDVASVTGEDAHLTMPHSDLDLEIRGSGPLFKNIRSNRNGKLSLQHFI